MTSYQAGDVVMTELPTAPGHPERQPALVILDTGDDALVLAHITSAPPSSLFDVALADWRHAGLPAPAAVRLHKLATVARADIRQRLGRLTASDRQHVSAVLPQLIAVWQNP